MTDVVTRFKIVQPEGPAHVAWLHTLGCCVPGCRRLPIHTHHVRSKGAGGQIADLAPICWMHHAEWHQIGRLTWQRKYDLDLTVVAAWLAFLSKCEGRLR